VRRRVVLLKRKQHADRADPLGFYPVLPSKNLSPNEPPDQRAMMFDDGSLHPALFLAWEAFEISDVFGRACGSVHV
jgi:hypothetical protein